MYKIKVNDYFDFEAIRENDGLMVNGELISADITRLNPTNWHMIKDRRSYNIEVVNFNRADKTAEIKINNQHCTISAKDQFDLLLEKMGLNNLSVGRISELKAPMPGMVLKVLVNEGMAVKKGDSLFILEAMKMENIIKASADVVIKSVKIKPGFKVEKGQVLIEF